MSGASTAVRPTLLCRCFAPQEPTGRNRMCAASYGAAGGLERWAQSRSLTTRNLSDPIITQRR